MTLLKCCTQYVSKFGKLGSGDKTEKGPFSLKFQRRAMPKNVQTIVQLSLFHMLARLCSKSFKQGVCSVWTVNFQMYKLGLEKAEHQRSNFDIHFLPVGSGRKQPSFPEKTPTSGSFDFVDHNKLLIFLRNGNTRSPYLPPEKPLCGSRSNS